MRLQFTKMQGAGNDFVVINSVGARFELTTDQLRHLADRRLGVGADQILVVEAACAADPPGVDFRYRIFNADGGEVEQCGNGARCLFRFVHRAGLTTKRVLHVATLGGVIAMRLAPDGAVTVDMGRPRFAPAAVPFDVRGLVPQRQHDTELWPIDIGVAVRQVAVLSMGNPHAVQLVADVDTAPVATDGPLLEHHVRFAQRVNAGFMQVVGRNLVRLRVWERGAGETLACGTGACAAVVAGVRLGLLDSPVSVALRGGRLLIDWAGCAADGPEPVAMTGPAVEVFDGAIDL
jgi:diaminopimelate epimerase